MCITTSFPFLAPFSLIVYLNVEALGSFPLEHVFDYIQGAVCLHV